MNLNFGENLKKLRRSRDMTQEELAEALGLSTQSVSRYETGGAYPDIEMLPVIAGYFGVTVDTLLGVSSEARRRRREEYEMRCHAKEADPRGQLEVIKQWRSAGSRGCLSRGNRQVELAKRNVPGARLFWTPFAPGRLRFSDFARSGRS